MHKLAIGEVLHRAPASTLQQYLDAGYRFNDVHTPRISVYKDTRHAYPYRFEYHTDASVNLVGAWRDNSWKVYQLPIPPLSFKGLLCAH